MEIKDNNYYGFDHKAVCEKFEGQLTYVGTMPVELDSSGGKVWKACAVYHNAKPDRSKSHKDYMLLFTHGNGMMVSGRDEGDIKLEWSAIKCLQCGEVMLSVDRHHFNQCGCDNGAFLVGGGDYARYGAKDMSQVENVLIDFKNSEIKPLT